MQHFLSTRQLADQLGMGSSTIRSARASGALRPAHETPGGHARWVLADVLAQLNSAPSTAAASLGTGTMTGMTGEEFAPLGVHDVGGPLARRLRPQEMVALGVREVVDAPDERFDATHRRWGGGLVLPRQKVA